MNRHKKITILVCVLLTALNMVACGQVKEDEIVNKDEPVSAEELAVNEQENSKQNVESINSETEISVNDSYYSRVTDISRTEVEDYAAYVKQSFMEHDWITISSEISYPITISGTTYSDSAAFLDASNDFDNNLNEKFFSYLEEEDCVEMFINSQGIMLGETGQIWIADVFDDKSNSHGLKIFAVNDLLREYSLSIEDFWKIKDNGSEKNGTEKGVKFATGLEIVYPDIWWGKIELTTDVNTLAVCEKGNADVGIGGDLFYLCFYEHDNDTVVIYDWDKVLGLYQQGGKEYVLVQDFPEDRCYSEDEQSLIDAYMELKNSIDNVVVNTDNMTGFLECGIEDLDWVQYESDWEKNETPVQDSAENQNDMKAIFVNRRGDVFNSEGDTVGIMATLKAFEWLVPRSDGECIADNLSAEENEFITESNNVLNGSEEAEDKVWIRIVQNPVLPTADSTIPHKDFIFYVAGEDAYVGIQSSKDNNSWAIWKMPDYGDWLEKEINIYIRMTTGL